MSNYIQVIPGATAHPQEYSLQQGLSSAFNSIANGLKANWDYKWQQQRNTNLLNQALHAYATGSLDGVSPDALPYLKGISDFKNALFNAKKQQISKTAQIYDWARKHHTDILTAINWYNQRALEKSLKKTALTRNVKDNIDYGYKTRYFGTTEKYKRQDAATKERNKVKNYGIEHQNKLDEIKAKQRAKSNSPTAWLDRVTKETNILRKLLGRYDKTGTISLAYTDIANNPQHLWDVIAKIPNVKIKNTAAAYLNDIINTTKQHIKTPKAQPYTGNKPLTPKQKAKLDQILGY